MRRTFVLCAILLVGCAQSQPPASETSTPEATPAMISLADVAGVWDGTITAAGSDTVLVNIELNATEDPTGWTMRVTNIKDPAMTRMVPATSVVAAGDSIVVEAGPFESVLRAGQQVTTHAVYRMENGNLMGMLHATYPASGETIMLQSMATRRSM